MPIDPTHLSLLFLGLLIVLVLVEVRKLSRKPEPTALLEQQLERLSAQVQRISRPQDLDLPAGARIVPANRTHEAPAERVADDLHELRRELGAAQELIDRAGAGPGDTSEALRAAAAALERMEARLDTLARAR